MLPLFLSVDKVDFSFPSLRSSEEVRVYIPRLDWYCNLNAVGFSIKFGLLEITLVWPIDYFDVGLTKPQFHFDLFSATTLKLWAGENSGTSTYKYCYNY